MNNILESVKSYFSIDEDTTIFFLLGIMGITGILLYARKKKYNQKHGEPEK